MSTRASYGVSVWTFNQNFVSRADITPALLCLKQTLWETCKMQTDFSVIWPTSTGMEVFVKVHTHDRQGKCFCWQQCVTAGIFKWGKIEYLSLSLTKPGVRVSPCLTSQLYFEENIFSNNGWKESQSCRWNGTLRLHWKLRMCVFKTLLLGKVKPRANHFLKKIWSAFWYKSDGQQALSLPTCFNNYGPIVH